MDQGYPAIGPGLGALLRFAEEDPGNPTLLSEAAHRAYAEGRPDIARTLIGRHAETAELPPPLRNLSGLVAIALRDYGEAEAHFRSLLEDHADDSGLRFNLAWSLAMLGRHEAALELLDDALVAAQPQAAALRIEMLHHCGRLDEALELGAGYASRFPGRAELFGALAHVALDAERLDEAARYAERAGDAPEGLSARGMVLLAERRGDEAQALFDAALGKRPDDPRALLGRGLALLGRGDVAGAAEAVDRSAGLFGGHVGSWVAAGWLRLIAGNREASRERFERARAIDENFAEVHGGLAVLDVLDGDLKAGRRKAEAALRLDRASFGAALATSLLAKAEGDAAKAGRLLEAVMKVPAGPRGETVAEALAAMGWKR